jgi:hypothetical protein
MLSLTGTKLNINCKEKPDNVFVEYLINNPVNKDIF